MSLRRWLLVVGGAASLSGFALVPPAAAGCAGWGCQPACGAPAFVTPIGPPVVYAPVVPCAGPIYPPQPAYRVEQGPIHNVVVVPYEEPHLRFTYLPPRFFADCACYR